MSTKNDPFNNNTDSKKNDRKPMAIMPKESKKEQQVAMDAYRLFREWRDNRNDRFSLFGDMTLSEYIDESKYRYITSVFERDGIEDWQGRMHVPITRNKIGNISGRAIQAMPIGEIRASGPGKHRRATILNNLHEYSEDVNSYALTMADVVTEAMVSGTAVIYEGHIKEINLERDIKSDGTISQKKIVKNKLTTTLVNLEDWYPSSVFVRNEEDLTGAAWRETLARDKFIMKYGTFEKARDIPAYNHSAQEDFPSYRDDNKLDLMDGMVEVIHIYRKDVDEYIILANGIWINPIKVSDAEDGYEVSPMPFKHKRLPFNVLKFEHLSANFIYGKSMPDKLRESQDQLDTMTNMVYDQSVMALFAPIITASADYIEDDFLRPGRRIAIDTGGQPVRDVIHELQITPPTGWYSYILDYTKSIIEDASVDALSSGSTADLADRTTARAVEIAADGIASTLTYFGVQIREFIKRKTTLRIGNIIQIYFDPKNPIVHKVIGENVEYINSAFNSIAIDNAELSPDKDGKIRRGRKIIEIYKDKSAMPDQKELQTRGLIESSLSGERVEIVALPQDYIRDMFEFDVKVVADKRTEKSKAAEQAVAMFKAQTYMGLFPDLVDREELAVELMEANGDDPSKLILSLDAQKEQRTQMQMQQGQQGGVGGGVANNFGNNLTQQMAGAQQQLK